jgi:CBS-domain-containing membrane protein
MVTDRAKAVRHMEQLQVRRLPVINKSKRMVGILSLGDLRRSASGDLLSEWVKAFQRITEALMPCAPMCPPGAADRTASHR